MRTLEEVKKELDRRYIAADRQASPHAPYCCGGYARNDAVQRICADGSAYI